MATSEQRQARNGECIDAARAKTYLEVSGAGNPLVLLRAWPSDRSRSTGATDRTGFAAPAGIGRRQV